MTFMQVARLGAMISVCSFFVGFSGCRFGNHLTTSPVPTPDPLLGFWETTPQSLVVTAVIGTTTQEVRPNVSLMPDSAATRFTNPVMMKTMDATNNILGIGNYEGGNAIKVPFEPDKKTFGGYSDSKKAFWYPDCFLEKYTELNGNYAPYSAIKTMDNGYPSMGSVALTYTYRMTFSGNCGATLTEMSDCYADSTTCGLSTVADNVQQQKDVMAFFEPFITTSAMTVNDIAFTTSLSYVAEYK